MELTSVKELYRQTEEYVDRKVSVGGWVRNNRDSKTFGFLVCFGLFPYPQDFVADNPHCLLHHP